MAIPPAFRRFASLVPAVCLALATPTALAAPPPVTPASAQANRGPIQQQAQLQIAGGDAVSAAMQLDAAARSSGDPVLFLDAADAYYTAAETSRDASALDMGRDRVKITLDILYFLRDPAATDDWRPVSDMEIGGLTTRANDYLQRANDLQAAIEAEQSGAVAAAPVDDGGGSGPPGRALMIAGGALTGLGVAGVAVGVTGLILGSNAQQEADDPTVYGNDLDAVDSRGKTANILAYGGLIGGGVLTAAGVALLVIGLKKKRAGGTDDMARVQVSPTLGGLIVRGRF